MSWVVRFALQHVLGSNMCTNSDLDTIGFVFQQPVAALSLMAGACGGFYVGMVTIDRGAWVAGIAMVATGVIVIVPGLWLQSRLDHWRRRRSAKGP